MRPRDEQHQSDFYRYRNQRHCAASRSKHQRAAVVPFDPDDNRQSEVVRPLLTFF